MKNKGWVKFHREQFSSWISKKPFCDGYAWTYLYQGVNHKRGMVNFRNEYIEVERGQLLTSKLKLQEIFGWTYRHVENFLKALKNDEMVIYRTTNRYIVITVINYERYQSNEEQDEEQNEEQVKNRLGTEQEQIKNEATQTRIKKNVKNDKNVKNKISPALAIFNYWKEKLNHKNSLLTKDRLNKINARLKEGYTIENCKQAIDGCVNSKYHQGENEDNKIYDSIELIFRNGDKIEQFMNYKKGDQNGRSNQSNDQSKKSGEDKYKHLEETY